MKQLEERIKKEKIILEPAFKEKLSNRYYSSVPADTCQCDCGDSLAWFVVVGTASLVGGKYSTEKYFRR